MELPQRKKLRLPEYDYSQNGAYFITICTQGKKKIFGNCVVGRDLCVPPQEPAAQIAWHRMREINGKFPHCHVDIFVVMPNHVHALLRIQNCVQTAGHTGPALQEIVQWYKTMTTNAYIQAVKRGTLPRFEKRIWQTGYYEHVVRNHQDYQQIWQYIENNPIRWNLDRYYEE